MIAILNYGVGNILSIQNMYAKMGIESVITNDMEIINSAKRLILPGVGNFDHCMVKYRNSNFFSQVERLVLDDKKPILGICVGLQMLFERSEEGSENGLSWIKGEVVKFVENNNIRIPHMGWNYVNPIGNNNLFSELINPKFYFVHSYYAKPKSNNEIIASTKYGTDFICAVKSGNILGVQFHPEKSHKYGMQLLKNFAVNDFNE
jgi:glutamine amidotransferase